MTAPALFTYRDGEVELCGEYYAPGAAPNGKGVLVIHEADGIGGNVRRHCYMLADLGYAAFAADMHGVGGPLQGDRIAPALSAFLGDRAYLRQRVKAGYHALATRAGLDGVDIAAIGYCFGGTAVLELARSGENLAAVASFHGLLTTPLPAGSGDVHARVLVCTGALDPLVPLVDVTAFQEEMAGAGADWQLAVFGRAFHSFTNVDVGRLNDPRMAFDPEAEAASWAMLLMFLDRSFALAKARP